MGKLPKKRTQVLNEKAAYGKKLGELKAEEHFKNTKKGWMKSLREHAGKLLDRVDPLETVAVAGMTMLIHETIRKNPVLLDAANAVLGIPEFLAGVVGEAGTFFTNPWQFFYDVTHPFPSPAEKVQMEGQKVIPTGESWQLWVLCFAIAYILVKHGGQLMGLLEKGLVGIVGMFLGVA